MNKTTNLKILLASDDESLAEILGKQGFDVCLSEDGFEVIRMAVESGPDVIFLDNTAGGLPVNTVAMWLKLNPATCRIPVIGFLNGSLNNETSIDAVISREQLELKLWETADDLQKKFTKAPEGNGKSETLSYEPVDATLELIDVFREKLRLSRALMELASLQPDLKNFDQTVRSVLKTAAIVLDSNLIVLSLLEENKRYVQVRGSGASEESLKRLVDLTSKKLYEHIGVRCEFDEEMVFGRKRLSEESIDSLNIRFFGHPVMSQGKITGYIAGIVPSNKAGRTNHDSILPELASQLAMVLLNARLVGIQDSSVSDLTSILRASIETSSISPVSDVTLHGFLLQFLLIVLELCQTTKGCVALLNEEKTEVDEIATLGCNKDEILTSIQKENIQVREGISILRHDEIILDNIKHSGLRTRRLIVPLATGEKVLGGLVILGIPENLSKMVLDATRTLGSLAASFVYNRFLHLKSIASSILEEQLKIAREIQNEMLPSGHPNYPGYDIYGRSVAAKQVGGDYYDYFRYEDGSMGIVIADVCGKSVPASLLMTMTRALFVASANGGEPKDILSQVNNHLVTLIGEGRFVTSAILTINDDRCRIALAGHTPLLVYRAGEDRFEKYHPEGIAMGIVFADDYEQDEIYLKPGDIVLTFTDGLNEAMDKDRKQFGYDRVKKIVRKYASESSEAIVHALFSGINEHTTGMEQFDDTTVIAIKKTSEEE